jgi:uncharacterized damage-inducible protein DinB
MTAAELQVTALSAEDVLKHWQGHRALTRRTIEAFPEDKLFSFSLGGMRPFAEMATEFIRMAVPIVDGVASGHWEEYAGTKPASKAELLAVWDRQTRQINERFPAIPAHRFAEIDKAFGQWEMSGIATIQYAIDNEIHHRGQGYVYLRALGIEPPHFWERG